jgi:hypothetical protein
MITLKGETGMAEGFRGLVGRKMQQKVKFMGEDVVIWKLSVAQVMEIQAQAKDAEKDGNADEVGFDVLQTILRLAVEGADDLSVEEFRAFPLDELNKLSNAIMKFSGVGADAGK